MLCGSGAYMCVTMSPRLSSASIFGIGDTVWPMWIITGRSPATSCARFNASRSPAPATLNDRRALTPAYHVAMARAWRRAPQPRRRGSCRSTSRLRRCSPVREQIDQHAAARSAPPPHATASPVQDPASTKHVTPSARHTAELSLARAACVWMSIRPERRASSRVRVRRRALRWRTVLDGDDGRRLSQCRASLDPAAGSITRPP